MVPIQRRFFYDGPGVPQFPSIVVSLLSSLATTLPVFIPLAGKLAFRPASGDVVVDCSPSAISSSGVKFVEAEFLAGADALRRLAGDDEHDTEAFARLVPELDDAGKLPAPVFEVQVTRPACNRSGVVAVGGSLHQPRPRRRDAPAPLLRPPAPQGESAARPLVFSRAAACLTVSGMDCVNCSCAKRPGRWGAARSKECRRRCRR